MAKSAKELFQRFQSSQYQPSLRKIRGTYLFQVDNVGDLYVSVNDGEITAEQRKAGQGKQDADCSFQCGEQDFIDITEGRRNLLTAILQGRVHVHGNAALAQKVHSLVRANAEQQREQKRGAA